MSLCVNSQNHSACAHQALKPVWRKSFTTTWVVGIPIRPAPVPQPQQGSRGRSGSCTTQEPCPPQSPTLVRPSTKITASHLARAFARRDRNCPGLLRPPAANLPSQDHQPGSAVRVDKLGGRFSPSYAWPQPRLLSTWAAPGCAKPSQ